MSEPTNNPDAAASEQTIAESERAIAEFFRSTLDAEYARRDRLDQRAASLIATTGGLVTIIGGIGALAPKAADFRLPLSALVLLVGALGMFLVSVVIAQWSSMEVGPLKSMEVADDAAELGESLWPGDPLVGRIGLVAEVLHDANNRKRVILNWATLAQMLAVVGLAIAVAVTLVSVQTS